MDVIAPDAANGFGACGVRVGGRTPGDAWPSVRGDPNAFRKIHASALERDVRISSISGYYITPQTTREHLMANVDAARALGAPLIAQGCFDGEAARVDGLLSDYAKAAADEGLRIALEFMPMSELNNLAQAQEAITRSGASNVGFLIDSLHLARSGDAAGEVAALDTASIYLTQLCDGPASLAAGSRLFDEAMTGRMDLGDGGLDLAGLVRALAPGAEIELETPVVADAALAPAQRAKRAADKATAFFDRHFP